MAEFVKPPKQLVDKTGKGVPGQGARALKKAEEAVKQHQNRVDYKSIAQESLDRINTSLKLLIADPGSIEAEKRIYELAHNLKGEGASFGDPRDRDRKSTRLNSSHQIISYAVFCLKKKNTSKQTNASRYRKTFSDRN